MLLSSFWFLRRLNLFGTNGFGLSYSFSSCFYAGGLLSRFKFNPLLLLFFIGFVSYALISSVFLFVSSVLLFLFLTFIILGPANEGAYSFFYSYLVMFGSGISSFRPVFYSFWLLLLSIGSGFFSALADSLFFFKLNGFFFYS